MLLRKETWISRRGGGRQGRSHKVLNLLYTFIHSSIYKRVTLPSTYSTLVCPRATVPAKNNNKEKIEARLKDR